MTAKPVTVMWSARLDADMDAQLMKWASQHRFLRGKSDILRAFLEVHLPPKSSARNAAKGSS